MAKFKDLASTFVDIRKKIERATKGFPKRQFKKRVGEKIIDRIRESVASGISPVSGYNRFKKYTAKYAARKGVDQNEVDLELTSEMLDAIEVKITRQGFKIGIYGGDAESKAETHNAGTQIDRGIPRRPFIPARNEKFKKKILKGIEEEVREEFEDELEHELKR